MTPLWAQASEPSGESALRAEVDALKERLRQMEELLREKLGLDAEAGPAKAPAAEQAQTAAAPAGGTAATAATPGETAPYVAAIRAVPTHAEPQDDAVIGPASTGGPALSITGLLDSYISYNTNDPDDGTNALYYTNPNSRGFGLNQAKISVDAKGDSPVGVHTDIWFGSGARLFRDGLEPGPLEDVIYLEQAYGYYAFENGAELDVGLFGTIAGLEVAESHLNWNYSRGLLWAWNEPFSHLGAKFSAPITDTFTGRVMLVNGFDNAFDENSGKSYGVQGSWAPSDRFNTTATWIHGPENDLTNTGWQRDFSWNFYGGLHEKFEVMANLDWISSTDPLDATATSWGIGGYARFNPTDKFRIAQRFEYFDDKEARGTGVEQTLKEYTLTFEYAPQPSFITRLEYRRDWSTVPYFGCTDCGMTGFTEDQNTITLGFMWIFGPDE
jgi:hypothetical protein